MEPAICVSRLHLVSLPLWPIVSSNKAQARQDTVPVGSDNLILKIFSWLRFELEVSQDR